MAMHTPGPWTMETVPTSIGTCHKIGPFPSRGVFSETFACVYADAIREHDYGYSTVGDELLANARLIAAAPDLLAALKALLPEADAEIEQRQTSGNDEYWADLKAKSDAARSAIAKAEGRA